MKTKTKRQKMADPDWARAVQEQARCNATVPKPARSLRKQRSRSGAKRAALRDAS